MLSVKECVTMLVFFRGMNHNVSWSLGNSLIDILLAVFLVPEQSVCTYPGTECQNTPSFPFQRSISEETDNDHYILLKCDHHSLARFNDTLCLDILRASGVEYSASLLPFCQALSSLSHNQVEQVWRNTCYGIQALLSPLVNTPSDCTVENTQPSAAVTPPSETALFPHREASNLQQLACNYNSWLESSVEAVLVSLCSDNEREDFVKHVCSHALLMRKLLSDKMNNWLYGYCANTSADPGYMVDQFCVYEQWLIQPTVPVDPALLEFCLSLDGPRLIKLICEHTRFFMILFSNPENGQFMPSCTASSLPGPLPHKDSLILDSCHYSEWLDVTQITSDILSRCIHFDHKGFTQEVCTNKTFLNSLLFNKANAWLEDHCNTSLSMLPREPTQPFNWCDYHTWGERQVDDSVVGFCWQNDRLAFQKNVCCKESVFEKLLRDPQNKWLTSVCSDTNDLKEIVLAQVSIWQDDVHLCMQSGKNECFSFTFEIMNLLFKRVLNCPHSCRNSVDNSALA